MGLQEAKDILSLAQEIMCQEAMVMSHIDGTEALASIVQMDLHVYSLIGQAMDILENYEDE